MLTKLFWRTFFCWVCVRTKVTGSIAIYDWLCVQELFFFFHSVSLLRNTTNGAVDLHKNLNNDCRLLGDFYRFSTDFQEKNPLFIQYYYNLFKQLLRAFGHTFQLDCKAEKSGKISSPTRRNTVFKHWIC